jgi:branched-chain amino acid transport system ATP-binding protein
MNAPLLKVTDLRAGYGRAEVLHGLSLEAAKGSVITVIGPNGAGKSTLLNTLMGILPGKGGIEFEGQSIQDLTLEERVMLGIALVPEKRELFSSMSVQDNLVLGAYRQVSQEAGTLSGGERQMLAVGRALMSRPTLLMLDEPSLGLAPLIVKEIFSIIETLRQTGVTIVLVEQNARAALAVADQGFVLEMGEIGLHGPASELAEDPRVIDTYLGAAKK